MWTLIGCAAWSLQWLHLNECLGLHLDYTHFDKMLQSTVNDSLRLRQRHRLSSVCPFAWWPSSLAACVHDASCFQITLALLRSPLLLFRLQLQLPKQCFSTSFHLQPCTTECTKCKITKETLIKWLWKKHHDITDKTFANKVWIPGYHFLPYTTAIHIPFFSCLMEVGNRPYWNAGNCCQGITWH